MASIYFFELMIISNNNYPKKKKESTWLLFLKLSFFSLSNSFSFDWERLRFRPEKKITNHWFSHALSMLLRFQKFINHRWTQVALYLWTCHRSFYFSLSIRSVKKEDVFTSTSFPLPKDVGYLSSESVMSLSPHSLVTECPSDTRL